MKAKITKTITHINGDVSTCESLYNFHSLKEAGERLQSIKNLCRYPIIEEGKGFFKANKYGDIYTFKVEKQ